MVDVRAALSAPVLRGIQNRVGSATLNDFLHGREPTHIRLGGVDVQAHDLHDTWERVREIWLMAEFDIAGFSPEVGECLRVLDIGAGVGIYAMLAGSRTAHVTAYEPDPERFADLEANTRKWDVTCRQAAVVGDPDRADGRSTVAARDALAGGWDLVHLDCGGAEFEILQHAGDALGHARRIIGRAHPEAGDVQQLLADLRAAGFQARLYRSEAPGGSVIFTGLRD